MNYAKAKAKQRDAEKASQKKAASRQGMDVARYLEIRDKPSIARKTRS